MNYLGFQIFRWFFGARFLQYCDNHFSLIFKITKNSRVLNSSAVLNFEIKYNYGEVLSICCIVYNFTTE